MNNKTIAANFNKEYKLDFINVKNFEFISKDDFKAKEKQQLSGKTQAVWKDVIKRFFKSKWNIFFTLLIIIMVLMVIIVPYISEYSVNDPTTGATTNAIRFAKPSWISEWNHVHASLSPTDYFDNINNPGQGDFDKSDVISAVKKTNAAGTQIWDVIYINKYLPHTILGTDSTGRDVWTRLFASAQWSLGLAILVATVETIIGTTIGIYIGFHVGKRIDTISMRVIEIFQSVPGLLWMFIFALLIGTSFFSMALVLILVGWVGPLYTARMFTLKVKDAEFIKAAESIGVSKSGRLYRHVLPNIVGRLLVSFVHRIPAVIFTETTLIFLGMTVGGEGKTSIGNMISDARSIDAITNNLMYAVSISCFLLVFSVSLQIIANGIRDAFDPKTEGGR